MVKICKQLFYWRMGEWNFLKDCYFHVCLSHILPAHYAQDSGMSQGSVLSVSLCAVTISGMANIIGLFVWTLPYAGDIAISAVHGVLTWLNTGYSLPQVVCHTGLWRMNLPFFLHPRCSVYTLQACRIYILTWACFWIIAFCYLFHPSRFWPFYLITSSHGNLTWDDLMLNVNVLKTVCGRSLVGDWLAML